MSEPIAEHNDDDDEILDLDEPELIAFDDSSSVIPKVWRMLIVDDDEDMHSVTRLVLSNFEFEGRPLELISAYSGAEAYKILSEPNDIGLILLDVVMETDDAGLVLTRQIREELKNTLVRIVLRTGQSGQAPETEVVSAYDINDYKDKSELTVQKLRTAVIAGLRAYKNMLVLEQALRDREAIDRLKSEFIAAVSHELRTPLTSIRGALGLLVSESLATLPEPAKHLITVAHRNAERLTSLVNDILDVESLSSNTMQLYLERIEIVGLTRISLCDNEPFAKGKNIHFEFNTNSEVEWVIADPKRIQQIFSNLLSNAIRFSPTGGKIDVRIDTKIDHIRIEVEDFGEGIPEEFYPNIFKKFSQAKSGDTRQQGGTGLGLNICKSLVEKMNGKIGFSSVLKKGTIFWFELPISHQVD